MGVWNFKKNRLASIFPELEALDGCPQEPGVAPGGDVWVHTLHCLDAFANERIGEEWEDLIVGFAVLCHDLGKPRTTKIGMMVESAPRCMNRKEKPPPALFFPA